MDVAIFSPLPATKARMTQEVMEQELARLARMVDAQREALKRLRVKRIVVPMAGA